MADTLNKKIMLVHNCYQQQGGEDAVFAAEATLLRQEGHEVVEYTEDNRRINGMNLLSVAAQTIWSRPSRQKLLQKLHDTHPDVVHLHNTFLLISPSVYSACKNAGVPVVQTLHNYRLLCPAATFNRDGLLCEACLGKTPPWRGVWHACYHGSRAQTGMVATMLTVHRWLKTWQEQVDVYVALTEFARKKFVEGGLPREKVVVKPNFVNPDPGVREREGHYALFVGRLSPEKGMRTLLRAWQCLREIPLRIAGDGPLMSEFQAVVQRQNLECADVLGQQTREKVFALMKDARFLVFPSEWYEGFPMTIAEAFACGVPVIVSQLGAMEEIVESGRTGLHFTPNDADDLACKVEWAWTHPKRIQEMGREARAEFEAKYTAERNYEMLMNAYQMAIERCRSQRG